ncbi:MAG: peptidase [Kiloniellales bacterium]
MTYCLAIKVQEGLVCLADGRLTAGSQVTNARKLSQHGSENARFCVMTSGLRSLRDKTIAYLERALRDTRSAPDNMLQAVEIYCRALRQVGEEDGAALEKAELPFNLHAIVAGRLGGDGTPQVFLVYPEGNWIEIDERTPYLSIGATAYGKPILDRALKHDTPLRTALKLAYLSFDSTRFSSADVGFPIDLLTLPRGDKRWRAAHYEYDDLMEQRTWWNRHITELAGKMPDGPWLDTLLPPPGAPSRLSLVTDD